MVIMLLLGQAFVRESARFFLVGTHSIFISFLSMISLIKWNRLSTCLDLWWDLSSFVYAMTLLLSQYKATRSIMLGTMPSSVVNFFLYLNNLFFHLKHRNVFSFNCRFYCNLLFRTLSTYNTLFKLKTYPDWDFLSLISDWKLTSK
jgi:hypothetical protein